MRAQFRPPSSGIAAASASSGTILIDSWKAAKESECSGLAILDPRWQGSRRNERGPHLCECSRGHLPPVISAVPVITASACRGGGLFSLLSRFVVGVGRSMTETIGIVFLGPRGCPSPTANHRSVGVISPVTASHPCRWLSAERRSRRTLPGQRSMARLLRRNRRPRSRKSLSCPTGALRRCPMVASADRAASRRLRSLAEAARSVSSAPSAKKAKY